MRQAVQWNAFLCKNVTDRVDLCFSAFETELTEKVCCSSVSHLTHANLTDFFCKNTNETHNLIIDVVYVTHNLIIDAAYRCDS